MALFKLDVKVNEDFMRSGEVEDAGVHNVGTGVRATLHLVGGEACLGLTQGDGPTTWWVADDEAEARWFIEQVAKVEVAS